MSLPGKLRQGPLSRGWTRCGPAPRTRHLWTPLASPTQSRTVAPLALWFGRQLSSTQFTPPPQTQIHTDPSSRSLCPSPCSLLLPLFLSCFRDSTWIRAVSSGACEKAK